MLALKSLFCSYYHSSPCVGLNSYILELTNWYDIDSSINNQSTTILWLMQIIQREYFVIINVNILHNMYMYIHICILNDTRTINWSRVNHYRFMIKLWELSTVANRNWIKVSKTMIDISECNVSFHLIQVKSEFVNLELR